MRARLGKCVRARVRATYPNNHLVYNEMHTLRVEDDVELAHVFEVPIERLDEYLDQVEDAKFRLGAVDGDAEIERGVLPVNDARPWHAKPGGGVHK